jgi:ribose/xylose/arabinose/galactoside ABC-type transport system permease subunit
MIFLQNRTPLGLMVASVGDNERAAKLSGHWTRAVKLLVYVFCGLGAALAGIIQSSQVHTACDIRPVRHRTRRDRRRGSRRDEHSCRQGLGGAHASAHVLSGGINNGMNILYLPIDIQQIAKGAIILAALAVSARAAR